MPPPSQPQRRSLSNLIAELQLMIIDYLEQYDKASLIESGILPPELFIGTANLDEGDELDNTMLHVVVERGYERATECLLQAGAPTSPKNSFSEATPLHHVSRQGSLNIVKMLLDHGASVHEWEWSGVYPLHHAAKAGHTRVVQHLLDRGAKQENNFDIGAPIHLAASKGRDDVVRVLIAHDGDVSSLRRGTSVLWLAVSGGHVGCARILLEAGADLNANNQHADWILPPTLFLAVAIPHVNTAVDIAAVWSVNEIDEPPALTWLPGQKETYAEIVRLLVLWGVDVFQDLDSVTALHFAAIAGNSLAVEILINAGVDIHRKTRSEWTALMYARVLNHEDTVELLLRAKRERLEERRPDVPRKKRYLQGQACQRHS